MITHRRTLPLFAISVIASSLLYAYYLQYFAHLHPCPLCIFQRLAYFCLLIVFFIACIHGPISSFPRIIYSGITSLLSLVGLYFAGKQVYLQHLPRDEVPMCGPGLDMLLQNFPLTEVLQIVLQGSGDCAEVTWQLLGLSMAEWSCLLFIVLLITSLAYAKQKLS